MDGELLLELLFRGSNPSGVGLLLVSESGVGAPLDGKLLLELLSRGSNPSSGVEVSHVQSRYTVGGWGPTCPIRVYLGVDTGNNTATRSAPSCQSKNHPTLTG